MRRFEFRLPDVGEGVTEAEISAWHVALGEFVEEDHPLLDVTTDKAVVDMTAPISGRVLALHGSVGERIAVGSILVELEIEETGAVLPATPADNAPAPAPISLYAVSHMKPVRWGGETSVPHAGLASDSRHSLAAPATRRRAKELGISLTSVQGNGPDGRIRSADLDAWVARTHRPRKEAESGVTEVKIIGIRRKIAEKMQEAKQRIPHFAYIEELDLTELDELRQRLNQNPAANQPKLTLLPFFMRALVLAIPAFPCVNARFDHDASILRQYSQVHIGVATQTTNGLIVPVVRNAQTLDIWSNARELLRVTGAARAGTATREQLTGSTITLTSLGALGGIAATPIINHPEVAIIGPNKLVERAVVREGRLEVRRMMNLSSSFDHRIVDGYDAAQFVQELKRFLEHPSLLFLPAQRVT